MRHFESQQEYERAFTLATRVEGFGTDVRTVIPCPACCAPDYLTIRIMHASEDMQQPATCKQCGLSTKSILTPIGRCGTSIETVLVAGALPNYPWMAPMRRAEDVEGEAS